MNHWRSVSISVFITIQLFTSFIIYNSDFISKTSSIIVSIIVGFSIYSLFIIILEDEFNRRWIRKKWWLSPNAICYFRVFIGWSGLVIYLNTENHFLGTMLFTCSGTLDAVDGEIARQCDWITEKGKKLDPLCDKLTIIPAFIVFFEINVLLVSVTGIISMIIAETVAQYVRPFLDKFNLPVEANAWGKTKTFFAFSLVIYCALLDDGLGLPNYTAYPFYLIFGLSIASSYFKLPKYLYGDTLTLLNLVCGVIGIYFAAQGKPVLTVMFILIGQIFDLVDGWLARKFGGTRYGAVFDNIADMVSFGICPAFLLIKQTENYFLSTFVAGIYFISACFRLWRYIKLDKYDKNLLEGCFNGMPTPAAAMLMLGSLMIWNNIFLLIMATCISILMVSHVKFLHGKIIIHKMPWVLLILAAIAITNLGVYVEIIDKNVLGVLMLLSSTIYYFTGKKIRNILVSN